MDPTEFQNTFLESGFIFLVAGASSRSFLEQDAPVTVRATPKVNVDIALVVLDSLTAQGSIAM
jgi:hypothetical protein